VFLPQFSDSTKTRTPLSNRIGIATAPLGLMESMLPMALYPVVLDRPKHTAYLHHSLTEKKPVYVDKDFPDVYIGVLNDVLAQWNKVFGSQVFSLMEERKSLYDIDCLSSSILCVFWSGPTEFSWTLPGGFSQNSFDPETGLILGGTIQIITNQKDLTPTPEKLKNALLNNQIDEKLAAEIQTRRYENSDFTSMLYPRLKDSVKQVLLHEIGHFNGFYHNFLGSSGGTIKEPLKTIMDYPAFPARHNATKLGVWDYNLINVVYKNQSLTTDYELCTDLEVWPKVEDGKLTKLANCNYFDVGDTAQWYIDMAQVCKVEDCIFKLPIIPPSLALFSSMQSSYRGRSDSGNLLAAMGYFLTEKGRATNTQKQKIKKYLCSRKNDLPRIRAQLDQEQGVELICN